MNLQRTFLILSYSIVATLLFFASKSSPVSAEDAKKKVEVSNLASSIVQQSHERVLMRRKRFLIFPKGAHVICTLSMVKAMVFAGPRGYNLLAEVDYFYPLPDSVDSLRPKRKKLKPATTTPAPPPPPPPQPVEILPEPIDDHEHGNHILFSPEFDHHPDVFVPDSGWRDDPNLALLRDVPPGVEVPAGVDVVAGSTTGKDRIWSPHQFDPQRLFRWPQQQQRPPVTEYWNGRPEWTHNQDTARIEPQLQRIDYIPQGRAMNEPDRTTGQRKAVPKRAAAKTSSCTTGTENAETTGKSSDWTEHEDWEHFDAHRDRRDLYKSLEGVISGINLQPCLLRTICEAQHFLLPKGKSLFHDIFKILFTLPVKDEFTDDYADAMRMKAKDCHLTYVKECPISILNMFLTSERVI